jgi:hypothetical protein
MTFATSAGSGEVAPRCLTLGSFAAAAGLRSIHSHRTAVANAPDKMAWICRIVAADIGRHVCGVQPDRAQSCPVSAGLARRAGRVPAASPATTARRPCRTAINPSLARTARA